MKKFVLIPDSFKGTMSSIEICRLMESAIRSVRPDAEVKSIPVADGGEGSVDAFLYALGGERITVKVKNPFNEEMESFYGLIDNGKTAVIEMAACAGLPLALGRENPSVTTTFGVGELMLDAAARGVDKIIVGLGGSATNDGGCGAAAAVGVKFADKEGNYFIPVGGTLSEIKSIDLSGRNPLFNKIEILTMCDINNPLYGSNGAAYIFGPQKGADPAMVARLDDGLRDLDECIRNSLGKSVADIPGAGAAGGTGAGIVAFFDGRLKQGIDIILDTIRFEEVCREAAMILTGEGKIDTQSLRGKVVIGVARRAKPFKVPVVAIVGDIGDNIDSAYEEGVSGIFSINRIAADFDIMKTRSKDDLYQTVKNLMRFVTRL